MMTPAYDDFVSPRKWRLVLLALALTVLGGAALAVALLLGAANPPYAAQLIYNAHDGADLVKQRSDGGLTVYTLPGYSLELPLTVELDASNSGEPGSAWGLALLTGDGNEAVPPVMIDSRGYVVTVSADAALSHLQFPHVRGGENRLVVNIDSAGSVTTYINDEVQSRRNISPGQPLTAALYTSGEPNLTWKAIKIYTGG